MAESIARTFAHWTANLTYEDLPEEVVDKIKALVLLHLVSGVMGAEHPEVNDLASLAKAEPVSSGGATIFGDLDGPKVTRDAAVLVNCEILHASRMFDSYRMITHPGPVLIAAALTGAELDQRTMKDFITALVAGYEFVCRLADDFVPSVSAHGYRPAPIFGTMGAALVAGKLRGLDEEGLLAAIAIAANCASGLNEAGRGNGTDNWVHELNAARQGTFAATIASLHHVRGSEYIIEGEAGFFNAYAGNRGEKLSYVFTGPRHVDLQSIVDLLGKKYKLLTVMFRVYPTGGYNQPVIDLMTELTQEHGLKADQIEEVTVYMNYLETLYPSPEYPRSGAAEPSVGSTQYFLAHAAVNGSYPVVGGLVPNGWKSLETDGAVLDFMANKVRVVGVYDQPMFSPEIVVHMLDGQSYRGNYPYARMEWNFAQLVTRLQKSVPGLPGGQRRLDQLTELAANLESETSVSKLFAAVQ